MLENKVHVSVWMITYNHAPYIAEAIDSIVSQKTNFLFELIIGEDASTDNTLEICRLYQKKYPTIIKILDHHENIGVHQNFIETYNACTGKYIAFCEGDDYWIDDHKLQKQVDFLELNQDYSICFHPAFVLKNNQKRITNDDERSEFDLKFLLEHGWFINTASMVCRKPENLVFPDWFDKIKAADYTFQVLVLLLGGKIKKLKDPMSVYRLIENSHSTYINHYETYLKYVLLLNEKLALMVPNNLKEIMAKKILKFRTELFYELRHSKKEKNIRDYMLIIELAIKLKKLNIFKLLKSQK